MNEELRSDIFIGERHEYDVPSGARFPIPVPPHISSTFFSEDLASREEKPKPQMMRERTRCRDLEYHRPSRSRSFKAIILRAKRRLQRSSSCPDAPSP
jgi:hypothetical protein